MTEISSLVLVKLIVHPPLTWWLAYHVVNLNEELVAIAVIQAALPIGVPVFVLVQNYHTFAVRSSAGIVISTVLSVVTLSLVLVLLGYKFSA